MKNRMMLILLAVMLALSMGLVGCGGEEVPEITGYTLTTSSTEGGEVITPGEGTFTYDEGAVINLVAEPEEGYRFVNWIGDMAAIADIDAAITTITMSADYSIMACFELKPTGAFLDEMVITSELDPWAAVQQLQDDALDVYAFGLDDPELYAEVLSDPSLTCAESLNNFQEFTFNPVGPTFPETGKLNPFSVAGFREAMHWLVDREYIAREIRGGLAAPRYTCLSSIGADATQRYRDLIAALEAKYAHNQTRAETMIAQEMEKLGAVREGGRWVYNGEPVELIFLIRTEDERKEMGDYFADLLEGLGFTVARQYGTMDDLRVFWLGGDPALGKWHIYTGGWMSTVIVREQGGDFGYFYTDLLSEVGPLWQAYVNDPLFYEAAEKLWNFDYTSMQDRRDLFEICLPMSMEDNIRMFLNTQKRFSPMRDDVRIGGDAVGGLSGAFAMYRYAASNAAYTAGGSGSWIWALTAHFVDDEGEPIVGGALRVAMPDVITNPWNPVAGSNVAYDTFAIQATSDRGLHPDPCDGLRWPGRIERAEVYVQEGVPVEIAHDWLTLESVPEIIVPPDAWADWDAAEQRFTTAAERFPEGAMAIRKSVVYYPKDIFSVPLHDGSSLSMGDFILHAILRFDRAKEASAIYDETAVAVFDSFMETFKGVKFIADDPDYGLIVETYSDFRGTVGYGAMYGAMIDAELCVATWFPGYDQNPGDPYEYSSGVWHTTALGIKAEEDGVLAFSDVKASALGVEWMNFIDGPSLPILKSYLDSAKAANYIPYEPTMGLYVTEAGAAERWGNLEDWYQAKKHFWVASGPFYLESADTTEKIIHLKRFEDYPDPMDRWLFLLEPLP